LRPAISLSSSCTLSPNFEIPPPRSGLQFLFFFSFYAGRLTVLLYPIGWFEVFLLFFFCFPPSGYPQTFPPDRFSLFSRCATPHSFIGRPVFFFCRPPDTSGGNFISFRFPQLLSSLLGLRQNSLVFFFHRCVFFRRAFFCLPRVSCHSLFTHPTIFPTCRPLLRFLNFKHLLSPRAFHSPFIASVVEGTLLPWSPFTRSPPLPPVWFFFFFFLEKRD